jgi:P-type E1-E2 ATPase
MTSSPSQKSDDDSALNRRAHFLTSDEIIEEVNTNIDEGLTSEEAASRLSKYGENKIPTQRSTSVLERIWAQVNSVLVYILVLGAAVSFGFEHNVDGFVIIGVVLVNTVLGYVMESKAENATAVLKGMMSPTATVLRDGDRQAIDSKDLTFGDVFFLQAGDIIPADARVIRSTELQVLEAALTGESHPIIKVNEACSEKAPLAERKSMVYSGTHVLKGTATCIAVGLGADCEIGKISALLTEVDAEKTPLVIQIEKFGFLLSIVIICLAILTFGVAYARGYSVKDGLAFAIGIAVAAIPEGLPSCITITFAIGVKYMAGHHAIVKTLPAVETLGSVSVICSDKTGTLTLNKMTVKTVITADAVHEVSAKL